MKTLDIAIGVLSVLLAHRVDRLTGVSLAALSAPKKLFMCPATIPTQIGYQPTASHRAPTFIIFPRHREQGGSTHIIIAYAPAAQPSSEHCNIQHTVKRRARESPKIYSAIGLRYDVGFVYFYYYRPVGLSLSALSVAYSRSDGHNSLFGTL